MQLRWPACDSGNLRPCGPSDPDVVIVGAGIAGASLATVLARSGLEVLVLERQREYRDRVRGEYMAPWGVLEARELGLEDVLRSTGPVTGRYSVPYDELLPPAAAEAAVRDTSTLLPGVAGALCTSHPKACQALAEQATRAGADVVRGVSNVRLDAGTRPSVSFQNGAARDVRPRLVVGADGRTSTVRVQFGIDQRRAEPTHLIAGMLVEGVPNWPDDHYTIGTEGDLHFYVFPQGSGRVRLYTCQAVDQASRWAGAEGPRRFHEAFAGPTLAPGCCRDRARIAGRPVRDYVRR
jgi:menaquinone-9 beta-reductase